MKPYTSLRQALADGNLLGDALVGESWAGWKAVLLAAMGEPLASDEREHFRRLTGRDEPPKQRVEELWVVAGRRGGKSRAIAVLITYLACLCDHRAKLVAGERGIVLCLAPSQMQAGVILAYISGILEASPVLKQLIVRQTSEQIELDNGIMIDIRAASFRRLRGFTTVAAVFDEMAFFHSDESANPDVEIVNAVRPSLGTTGGLLAVISSPYARRGELFLMYKNHYGSGGDPSLLIAHGTTADFNPSLPRAVIDRAMERDAASASAEYGAVFRTDIETFISREAVEACVSGSVLERQPNASFRYSGFVDPSGGAGGDSFTLAIAHKEQHDVAVLDCLREIRPPFSPENAVRELANTCLRYRLGKVVGDRFSGDFVREQFRKNGIAYHVSEKTKSELYGELLPLINSRVCDLLDHPRLHAQLTALERRTSAGGRDTVTHPPNAHDDLANACAGALVLASAVRGDGKEKRERVPLPAINSYYHRPSYHERGTAWMAGPRRWN